MYFSNRSVSNEAPEQTDSQRVSGLESVNYPDSLPANHGKLVEATAMHSQVSPANNKSSAEHGVDEAQMQHTTDSTLDSTSREQYQQTQMTSISGSSSHKISLQYSNSTSTKPERTTEATEFSNKNTTIFRSHDNDDKRQMHKAASHNAETVYDPSETSTRGPLRDEHYLSELAGELFGVIRSHKLDSKTSRNIVEQLPELLRAFALKVGHRAQSPMHRDISYFVYKRRWWVSTQLAFTILHLV